jgi:hypothetical protein
VTATSEEDREFLRWLLTQGYTCPTALPGNRYAAIFARTHNTQIIVGPIGNKAGFDDAW